MEDERTYVVRRSYEAGISVRRLTSTWYLGTYGAHSLPGDQSLEDITAAVMAGGHPSWTSVLRDATLFSLEDAVALCLVLEDASVLLHETFTPWSTVARNKNLEDS